MDFRKASQAHVVPHFTKGAAWNADDLIVMDHAEGCYVTDSEGKRYLDGAEALFEELDRELGRPRGFRDRWR